jgi:type IV pilus assembly protein PilB
VEPYNFVSALNCILAQRLVRQVCEFCVKDVYYTDAELEENGLDPKEWQGEMLLAKKPGSEIRKKAKEKGMAFLRDSALDRVREGVTTLKEINKVTFIEAGR